jgi:ABC-type maltose transport system permease subunit
MLSKCRSQIPAQPRAWDGHGRSLLMTLPVIAIFFFAQRYFLRGVTLTGMKG